MLRRLRLPLPLTERACPPSSHDGMPSLHVPLCKHSQHPCSTSQPTLLSAARVFSHPLGNFSPKHHPPPLPPVDFQGGEGARGPWILPFWIKTGQYKNSPPTPTPKLLLADHRMTGGAKRRVGNKKNVLPYGVSLHACSSMCAFIYGSSDMSCVRLPAASFTLLTQPLKVSLEGGILLFLMFSAAMSVNCAVLFC